MNRRQRGMTLIEAVIAIVVIGVCVVSALGFLSALSVRGASSMLRTQATAVAAAYLENIVAQPYGNLPALDELDHIGARDANGNSIAGLQAFRIHINVDNSVTVGTPPRTVPATRIDVTVTDPTGATTRVSGHRINFVGQVIY